MVDAGHIALRDGYFSPTRLFAEGGVAPILRGLVAQKAQRVDTRAVDDVRNLLFGTNTQGFDLVAINIQRGRDHGLPDYNTVRKALGFAPVVSFADITGGESELAKSLAALYDNVDNLDLWVAGLAEPHVDGGIVGETFSAIIREQFTRLRDGDRFWYENVENSPLSDAQRAAAASTSLVDVLARSADVHCAAMADGRGPFFARDPASCV